jgi:hypothetical protein
MELLCVVNGCVPTLSLAGVFAHHAGDTAAMPVPQASLGRKEIPVTASSFEKKWPLAAVE